MSKEIFTKICTTLKTMNKKQEKNVIFAIEGKKFLYERMQQESGAYQEDGNKFWGLAILKD